MNHKLLFLALLSLSSCDPALLSNSNTADVVRDPGFMESEIVLFWIDGNNDVVRGFCDPDEHKPHVRQYCSQNLEKVPLGKFTSKLAAGNPEDSRMKAAVDADKRIPRTVEQLRLINAELAKAHDAALVRQLHAQKAEYEELLKDLRARASYFGIRRTETKQVVDMMRVQGITFDFGDRYSRRADAPSYVLEDLNYAFLQAGKGLPPSAGDATSLEALSIVEGKISFKFTSSFQLREWDWTPALWSPNRARVFQNGIITSPTTYVTGNMSCVLISWDNSIPYRESLTIPAGVTYETTDIRGSNLYMQPVVGSGTKIIVECGKLAGFVKYGNSDYISTKEYSKSNATLADVKAQLGGYVADFAATR